MLFSFWFLVRGDRYGWLTCPSDVSKHTSRKLFWVGVDGRPGEAHLRFRCAIQRYFVAAVVCCISWLVGWVVKGFVGPWALRLRWSFFVCDVSPAGGAAGPVRVKGNEANT